MATRNANASYVANSEAIPTKLHDAADGPGKAPYIDGRELASYLAPLMKVATFDFIVDTTLDEDGDVIAAGDDLVLDLGFTPLRAVLSYYDPATETDSQYYEKFAGMAGAGVDDKWAYFVDSGAAPTITDARMSFQAQGLTIYSGATIAAKTYKLIVFGQ